MPKTDTEIEPSDLDDLTHLELRAMHQTASSSILFAKFIQWSCLGFAQTLLFAAVFLVKFSPYPEALIDLTSLAIILLACGTIFILFMYQMWQFNEIRRIRQIEKHFSSLSQQINHLESRRERNTERYTMLAFKVSVIIAGTVIALTAIQ